MFSGHNFLLNCNMRPNARAASPDDHSECGYTKATGDTCTSFMKTLNNCTLFAVSNITVTGPKMIRIV